MSPFGGSTNSVVWEAVDARMFLQPEHRGASRVQAAFRAAYLLPPVTSVAVGSDDAEHLRELVDAPSDLRREEHPVQGHHHRGQRTAFRLRVKEELLARRHLEAVESSVQPMVKRWFWAPRSQRAVR